MTEGHFIVTEAAKGGYLARAVEADIFTEADDLDTLSTQLRDAVHCQFGASTEPRTIRLHISREEVLAG